MKIEPTSAWMEDTVLQVQALRMALHEILMASPELRDRVQFVAENTQAALLPFGYTDKQAERIASVISQLAERP